ncbi:hypothetical protein ACFQZC_11410 [Streptacidiphilus monticola]
MLGDFRKGTGADLNQSQVSVVAAQGQTAAGLALGQRLAHAPGVRNALTFADHWGTLQGRGENDSGLPVTVADCTTLAHLARIADCSPARSTTCRAARRTRCPRCTRATGWTWAPMARAACCGPSRRE